MSAHHSPPVLFLDVDGVLNQRGTLHRFQGVRGVDPEKVEQLHRIIAATDCRIVLASTWRKYPDHVAHLAEQLGVPYTSRLIGQTPVDVPAFTGGYTSRGHEIGAFLAAHPEIKVFVILDDDRDMGQLTKFAVYTDDASGLTPAIANKVISRLKFGGYAK